MSSYNSGSRRISSDDLPRIADVSSGPAQSGLGLFPRPPRSQIARPVNSTPRSSRASSLSSAGETSQTAAPVHHLPPNRTKRLSILPRPATGGSPASASQASPTSHTPSTSPVISFQSIPRSPSTPNVTNPSAFVPSNPAPPANTTSIPRNVLRRKAATIGKHMGQDQSFKLSLVIPQPAQPTQSNETKDPKLYTPSESQQSAGFSSTSSLVEVNQREKNDTETPKTNGPEELASLRTEIDTQNLPAPPTPFFPSASTPSTRYSGSPGMWSRGSTPTTMSSYSPGIVQTAKVGRLRQASLSQTRLPVFSPPPVCASPQSAQIEQVEPKIQRSAIPKKTTTTGTSAGTRSSVQKSPNSKSPLTNIHGPAPSPPPRKSSINFSPSKDSDIDVEKARKEVEEAERELSKTQRPMAASSSPEANAPKTPPRPSRHDTPRLEQQTSPVVQSNLPQLKSTGHTRRESAERVQTSGKSHPTQNQSAAASVDSLHSKGKSQAPPQETGSTGSPTTTRKSPRTLMRISSKEKTDPKKTTTPKRFGIFPKRSKSDLNNNSSEQTRSARKGPAAGTGHEGYGKYSQRGRKASASSSSGPRTSSTSTTRSAPQSFSSSKGSMSSHPDMELDDFLMSRLEPVVISGGGVDGDSLARTQSEQSASSVSVASSNLPRLTALTSSNVPSTDSLATSTGLLSEASPGKDARATPGSSETKEPERKPVVVDRPAPKSRMPVPKGKKHGIFSNSEAAKTCSSLPNRNSKLVTEKLSFGTSTAPGQSHEPAKNNGRQGKKTSRWNLFQRHRKDDSKSSEPPAPAPESAPPSHTAQLHAAIAPVASSRPVAHYALVDTDSDELDDIIKKVEDSPLSEEEEDKEEEGMVILPAEVPPSLNIRKRQPSILLPSPPKMHSEFERDERPSPKTVMFNRNMMDPETDSSPEDYRPRRLASVGRIPQVVSRRDRQHRPAMQSFSRPFSVIESPPSLSAVAPENATEHAATIDSPPKPPVENPFGEPMKRESDLNQAFSAPEQARALDFLAGPYSNNEFLRCSPPKGSPSSSSSGALGGVTAVPPKPDTVLSEDEVWDEYDDLLDHVLTPGGTRVNDSTKFGQEGRFELATIASRALQDELNNASSFQPPSSDANRSSSDSIRLRRSRIVSALQLAPSAQSSYSNLVAAYRGSTDGSLSSPTKAAQASSDKVQQRQSTFLHSLANTAPTSKRKSSDDRKSITVSSERDWDAVTRTNMRSASLMTSRWLSFGRVLFSPAHNHVKAGSQGRILVIDGLGNDDWSFYCSLTYPDAEVYSLSSRPVSSPLPHPAAWQPPTNHHTVYHAGLENPLPFPKDYFNVAVLRFPAASSEAVQSNIIQECKRVLRSGGYLEMSLLDRDMVNMGVRTRKSIRRLKEMTCLAHSSISLSPTSDSVQRLVGTQGFDNLRRCMVRIPVAGMVVRSSGSTTSSSNKSLSATTTTPSTAFSLPAISVTTETGSQNTATTPPKTSPSDDNVSLGDLLSDPSPSAANDESIAKIVARVGRWWYTKCYEDPVLPDTGDSDPSMWNDRKVLRECQKRGTGFRMLIAYAQKPSEVKRRTASV